MTKFFAFESTRGPGSPRVFQVAGNQHRFRLSLRRPHSMGLDGKICPGGMEIIEKYRQDPRWQEITDAARLADIAIQTGWAPL